MRTFGTLGHVDHGKSTLVHALTGIDPDRLAEEKAREMTIDLGFAWLPLSNGETIGIVDVPGHRDFIENMLAGVTGVEAVLLVIAADEGVMPQTREHIAILKLLAIQHGVIVMTKTDMIDDDDWLQLIESDIRAEVANTPLAANELIAVSARTGANMPALRSAIEHCANALPPQRDTGIPQLAVDRVFTMHGFGTVVTGTLRNGALHQGEEIEVHPGALRSRIRTLQVFNHNQTTALPGSRVAINIPNIRRDQIHRGATISRPGLLMPSSRVDVFVTLLDDAHTPLRHNTEVRLFISTSQTDARVRVLGADAISPGEQGWVQVETKTPLIANRGDRCILRSFSPSATIGGGEVINPSPSGRHRRLKPEVVAQLEAHMCDAPPAHLAQLVNVLHPIKSDALRAASGLTAEDFQSALQQAIDEHLVIEILPSAYMNKQRADALIAHMRAELHGYHAENPLHQGIQQDILRNRLGVKPAMFQALVERAADVKLMSGTASLIGHTITFTPLQKERITLLLQQMAETPFLPPSYAEAALLVGDDVLGALISLGDIVRLTPDVIFEHSAYQQLVHKTLEAIEHKGSVTVSELRDVLGSSRKYVLALLEDLDAQGITRRIDDVRVRGHKS